MVFVSLLALFAPFRVLAAEIAVLPSVVDAKLRFRAIVREHGVEFRWFRYRKSKDFVKYEILRTGKKPAGKIIQDGVVAGETKNRYSTNFEEMLDFGTYYYQLCQVTKTKRICSGSRQVVIANRSVEPLLAKEAGYATSTPTVTYKPAPAGELELTVVRGKTGVAHLSWSPLKSAAANFKYYKPLRSTTVDDPFYPRDGYLSHIVNWDQTVAIDDRVPTGTVHYRVCAVDGDDGLFCGNVVKLGGIQ